MIKVKILLYATRQEFRLEFSYRKTAAVYTHRFGLLEVTPDRMPIRPSARIGSNSSIDLCSLVLYKCKMWML